MKSPEYWQKVRELAKELKSDGCTGVPDFFLDCCFEHDVHWRSGVTLDGNPISQMEANRELRRCIQSRSKFGFFSPLAWERFIGTTLRVLLKKLRIWR